MRVPRPRIKQTFKLSGEPTSAKDPEQDFVLKQQHTKLFALMDSMQNGVITLLVFKDGLPFTFDWEVD